MRDREISSSSPAGPRTPAGSTPCTSTVDTPVARCARRRDKRQRLLETAAADAGTIHRRPPRLWWWWNFSPPPRSSSHRFVDRPAPSASCSTPRWSRPFLQRPRRDPRECGRGRSSSRGASGGLPDERSAISASTAILAPPTTAGVTLARAPLPSTAAGGGASCAEKKGSSRSERATPGSCSGARHRRRHRLGADFT